MIVDETITNLQRALAKLTEKDPQLAKYLELKPTAEADRLAAWEIDRYDRRWLVDGEAQTVPPADYHGSLDEAVVAAVANVPTEGQVSLLATADWLPPVLGSPLWFLEEVAEAYGEGRTDYLVDELCGLKVVQREELSEPVLIMADGKWYTIVPEWARRTAAQIQADEFARRASSAPAGWVAP